MSRHHPPRAVTTAPLVFLLIASGALAQDSGTSSNSSSNATQASSDEAKRGTQASDSARQGRSASAAVEARRDSRERDPELAAIRKAENEERWIDADKLLRAAIQKAEESPELKIRLILLLEDLARLNFKRGQGQEAIAVRERILNISEELDRDRSRFVVSALVDLAGTHAILGHDQTAKDYFEKALTLARESPGPSSSVLLYALRALAAYHLQHDGSAEAEPLIEEALRVCQPDPGNFGCESFRRLQAQVYSKQGHLSAAERIGEDTVTADASSDQPWYEKAAHRIQLARQYEEDGAHNFAEANYRQALALYETNATPNQRRSIPSVLNRLGEVLVKEGRNAEAEDLFKGALDLQEKTAPAGESLVGRWLDPFHLESLYRSEGRLADIEPIFLQVLAFAEQTEGPESMSVGWLLFSQARIYNEEGKYSDAAASCDRTLKIQEAHYGPDSPQLMSTLWTCYEVANHLGDTEKASALESRLKKLREK